MSIKVKSSTMFQTHHIATGKGLMLTAIHCITATLTYQQNDCAVHH